MKALLWFALYVAFVVGAAHLIGRALDREYAAMVAAIPQGVR